MLHQNKENIPSQCTPKLMKSESRNKLKPTSKANLDLMLRSSEKSLIELVLILVKLESTKCAKPPREAITQTKQHKNSARE